MILADWAVSTSVHICKIGVFFYVMQILSMFFFQFLDVFNSSHIPRALRFHFCLSSVRACLLAMPW